MAFDITTFKKHMAHDGARPNLFEVVLTGGESSGFAVGTTPKDSFMIRASSLPGSTLGTAVVPYFGREVKFAGNRTFADWTVTVINDETFSLRGRLETWMNNINGHTANKRIKADYAVDASVKQFSKMGGPLRIYTFHKLFPIDLSEITLDWGDNDSIEEFTCTFAYDYWTAATGDTVPATPALASVE
jgi:hypothetical protein